MAGDWIKMRVALTYDLKVMQIARTLNGDACFLNEFAPDCQIPAGGCNASALHTFVIGALHRFWCAAQEVTADGKLGALEKHDIDCLVGCHGFSDALIEVGWIEELEGGLLQVHNWNEHNGESAKKRALGKKRVEKHREEKRESVTPVKRASVTREEKRREDNKEEERACACTSEVASQGDKEEEKDARAEGVGGLGEGETKKRTFVKPTLDEVRAYCQERGNNVNPETWYDHYTSNGWRVGKNGMKDWKAAVRTWERNDFDKPRDKPAAKLSLEEEIIRNSREFMARMEQ